jgi:hypothetical protein
MGSRFELMVTVAVRQRVLSERCGDVAPLLQVLL